MVGPRPGGRRRIPTDHRQALLSRLRTAADYVNALIAVAGGRVYVGGSFSTANGIGVRSLVALSARNGSVVRSYRPRLRWVNGIESLVPSCSRGRLYVASSSVHVSPAAGRRRASRGS
jgi:outer membrane protein assembly factor BamB